MANVLTELPARKGGGGGRSEKYPFDEWLDGQVWELVAGEDFECERNSMRTSIYGAAKRRGVKVLSRDTENGIAIQAQANGNGASAA